MKALKYGFGLILVGGFALTASCGGSSGDDSSSAAGSTSSAGTSDTTAGTGNGSGGTDSGTSGTTGSGGLGTGTGGTGTGTGGTGTGTGGTGTGTAGAGAGTGGAGAMNPAGCPAASTMPKTGDACTATTGMRVGATVCTYAAADPGEDTTCACAPARGGGRGPGGGAAGAPDVMDTLTCATACAAHTSTPPTTGEACTLNAFTTCTFGPNARTNTDRCRCAANKWACTAIGMMGAAGAAN